MQFKIFVIFNLISVLLCSYFIIHFTKRLKVKPKRQIIMLLVVMLIWTTISLCDAYTSDLSRKMLLTNIGYIAYALLTPCWFEFIASFIFRKNKFTKNLISALYIISIVFILLNWFNPLGVFYKSVSVVEKNGYSVFAPEYGFVFWLFSVYSVLMLVCTLPWTIIKVVKGSLQKTHLSLILAAQIFALTLEFIYVLGVTKLDFTSCAFSVICIVLFYLHKKDFFSKSPLSHNSIIENMSLGYILTTANFKPLEINNAAKKLLYLDDDSTDSVVENIITKEWSINATVIELGDTLRSLESPCGILQYYRITANKITIDGDEGFYYAFFIQDETALHAARKRMQYLERYDEPTGLFNRSYFMELLEKEIARYQDGDTHTLVLATIQIMNYHNSCTLWGSVIGDFMAQIVGETFKGLVRSRDAVCRFSSSEIYVFLRFEKTENMVSRIEEILKTALKELEKPVKISGKTIEIKPNIGVAFAPKHATTSSGLIIAANIALRNIVKFSKKSYSIYHENSGENFNRKIKLENDMPIALEKKQFQLLYQPQVDIRNGIVVGVEALIRWNHPELGIIMPVDFIPIAEENGLIQPIGLWVIREAIKSQKQWQNMGLNIRVSVNVSLNQLPNPTFADEVIRSVIDAGVDASNLELELTESIALFPEALEYDHLSKLRSHGIRIAMDDFGMGHSSLTFIKEFEPNTIKIDRALSNDILSNQASIAMIQSVRNLCGSLDIDTIVEYIEHREQLKILKELSCFIVQGYLFSVPLSAEDCTSYILEANKEY